MRVGIVAILMATAVCLTVPVARAQADCAAWKSRDFFATASAADVRACLRAGADPGAQNGYGETPLHRAAGSGHAEAIGALIKGGADRNALAEHGYTPLHIIAMEGDTATIAALLEGGADAAAEDDAGVVPLHLAEDDQAIINAILDE